MHAVHQPAGHTFTANLLKIVQQTELLLDRRVEATERADALHSLEVTESTWGEWGQAMLEWKPEQIR